MAQPTENKPRLASSTNDAQRRPQIIGHRGFASKYPENSSTGFKGAVEVGGNAIEMDLALSKDGVVVISHDQSLKRCFGVNKRIPTCEWEYLKTVKMSEPPHETLPLLADVLKYLASPEAAHVWVFLDIKLGNKPDIIPHIAQAIASVAPHPDHPWHTRLICGCWTSTFIPEITKHLPEYRIALVCFDLRAARRFFPVDNLTAYNVNQQVLMGPLGRGFLQDAQKSGKQVFVWTVNSERAMRWCIKSGADGVVTDDPELCRHLVEDAGRLEADQSGLSVGEKTQVLVISLLAAMFGWIYRRKYLRPVDVHTSEQPTITAA